MKHIGNLTITNGNKDQFKNLTEVTGYLYVHAEFDAPVLTTIGDYLEVCAEFDAPVLTTIGSSLYVHAEFNAPVLTTIGSSLYVRAEFNAPVLTTIGSYLEVHAEFNAPVLTTIGGYLEVHAEFDAPVLTTIGDYLYVHAEFDAPRFNRDLKTPMSVVREIKSRTTKATLDAFERQGFLLADGILQKIISKKQTSDLTVYKVKHLINDDVSFAVYDGENYSHGETLEEAKTDLMFKLTSQDTSEFKGWAMNDEKLLRDIIRAYRSITGACSFGVKSFCQSHDLKTGYTLNEVIELTKDRYGHEKFKNFFMGSVN